MNDIEKAIDDLKMDNTLMEFDPSTGDERPMYKANLLAIETLEKQIPKKPVGTFTDGVFKRSYNICPVCESYVNRTYHQGCCGKCGQILDWSVEE